MEIRQAFDATKHVKNQFLRIDFHYCFLSNEEDIYATTPNGQAAEQGYKSGPNNQFFLSMDFLSAYGEYAFYMETDCTPIRPNWLGHLQYLVSHAEGFWVMGSIYRGIGDLDEKNYRHLNGNAIYAVGNPSFKHFLVEVWKPELLKIAQKEFPLLAYDFALDYYFQDALPLINRRKWQQFQSIFHKFRATAFIQNQSGFKESVEKIGIPVSSIVKNSPDTYIVHGRHLWGEILEYYQIELVETSSSNSSVKAKSFLFKSDGQNYYQEKEEQHLTQLLGKSNYSVKICFQSAYNKKSFQSEGLPPMPFTIGPIAVFDYGTTLIFQISLKNKEQKYVQVAHNMESRTLCFIADTEKDNFKLVLDNQVIYKEKNSNIHHQNYSIILGKGLATTAWKGTLEHLELISRNPNSPSNQSSKLIIATQQGLMQYFKFMSLS